MNFLRNRFMWNIGALEVHNPYALADAMRIILDLRKIGVIEYANLPAVNLLGKTLTDKGLAESGEEGSDSVGRTWLCALKKLGFLYPKLPSDIKVPQSELGQVDVITPNGWRLIEAENVPAMQECFLRALAAYYVPFAMEREIDCPVFSPLRHILAVMLELENQTKKSHLDFIEMAIVVQFTNSKDNLTQVVAQVLDLRRRRVAASNKRKFDKQEYEFSTALHHYSLNTINDYADTNIRYMRSTRLVHNEARGICFMSEKHNIITKLIQETNIPESDISYLITLCNGAELPTDDKEFAIADLNDLLRQLIA